LSFFFGFLRKVVSIIWGGACCLGGGEHRPQRIS